MTKRFFFLAIIAWLAVLLPAGTVRAEGPFTFYGAGWGHGIGVSQWGAYGLAQRGWGAEQILTHFYSGAVVRLATDKPARVRVGLLQWKKAIDVKAESGKLELRMGDPTSGTLVGTVPNGSTWTVEADDGKYRITSAKGKLVGGQLWGGSWKHLFVVRATEGARARIGQTGHAYNRGWLELNVHPESCTGCTKHLRLIADVPASQYLYGLAEVPSSWPVAALRAQAIAARTYAFEKIARLGQHRDGCNCGLYGTTQDQVYAGWTKEGGVDGNHWVSAVDATAGQVVTYQGAYIQAYYHASSGGHTENIENLWGGSSIPYLRGVCDTGDSNPANPHTGWSVTLTGAAAGNKIAASTSTDIGSVARFVGAVRGVSGRIKSIRVEGTDGEITLTGSELRAALGLKDSMVWVNSDRTIAGSIRDTYDALNCRPGVPTTPETWVEGGHRQRFTNGAIYHNHARGLARWLHGPIYLKYVAMQEAKSVLGLPWSGVEWLAKLGGSRARFEGGSIYFEANAGAHALSGRVLNHFLVRGGAFHFGFPVTDVTTGEHGWTWAEFTKGARITCPKSGACKAS
jgi:SpoIID/LytB domain protein